MLEQEILKEKYRILKANVIEIRNDLRELNEDLLKLKGKMKNGLMIDNKIVEEELYDSINKSNENINEEINYQVIPNINNNI